MVAVRQPVARPSAFPGRLLIVVGPDGVGKTTVARAVMQRHAGPTGYFHFLPPLSGPLARAPEPTVLPPPPKAGPGGSRVLGWLRLFRNAGKCWLGYLSTVRPALARDWLIVGDRWMYGYLVQPDALKFYGPAVLARAVLHLLPCPDLVVNLSAPPQVIRARKQELGLSEIERELLAWSALPVPNVRTIDATRSPHVIASEILSALRTSTTGDGH
jgi:thymidylate kinase